jgi:hypothetical protein
MGRCGSGHAGQPAPGPSTTRQPCPTGTDSNVRHRPARPADRQIRSLMLGVELVGSRRILPAHVGWLVDPDGSRRDRRSPERALGRGRRTPAVVPPLLGCYPAGGASRYSTRQLRPSSPEVTMPSWATATYRLLSWARNASGWPLILPACRQLRLVSLLCQSCPSSVIAHSASGRSQSSSSRPAHGSTASVGPRRGCEPSPVRWRP